MKINKFYFLPLVVLTIGLLTSCSDDDENSPKYEFIDQNLQGTINGASFTLGDAIVEISNGELSIELFSSLETESGCDIFFGEYSSIFFDTPNEIGIKELSFDFSSFDGQTITLFDPDGNVNIIATEGALEIVSITETTVSGKIDARAGDGDFVNGNFTATFCD